MSKTNAEKITIEISDGEINRRLDQIEEANLPEDLKDYLISALKILVELDRIVGLQETTIARLRKIFGKKSEKQLRPKGTSGKKGKASPKKGHGRNSHDEYANIPEEHHQVKDYSIGDLCPKDDSGKLYPYYPRVHILISGGTPFRAKKVVHATLRCNICGLIIEAKSDATGKPKYDVTVPSMLAVLHYGNSFPLYRLEKLQKMLFTPMPRSVQWTLLLELGLTVKVVWEVLFELLANADCVMSDDTKAKILSHARNIANEERKQLSTTGMRAVVDGHEIVLFQTGRNNSGENLDKLIEYRSSTKELTIMSDASANNNTSAKKDFKINMINCLTHARRKFVDVEKQFEEEASKVIGWIATVYRNEDICKETKLSDEERLVFHKEHSTLPMEELKAWCDNAFPGKLVEPNSSLGNGIKYLLNHWHELTGFLRIEGAPLDTNILEMHLRGQVMNRKNWLFFKTETGALIGDILSSLIKTCERSKENPFEYLNALQTHEKNVKDNPNRWLPWNFRENFAAGP